jgi:hypothetical protein
LRNSRRTARYFANVLPGTSAKLHFAHGLYVTLIPKRKLRRDQFNISPQGIIHKPTDGVYTSSR